MCNNRMYMFSSIRTGKQGDELLEVQFSDGTSREFHIWDYPFLYSYPDLYRQLIVDFLKCGVYDAIEKMLISFIPKRLPLRIADIACGSGLMGKKIIDSPSLAVQYLAGVEITAEALKALNRDTPGIYNRCFLFPEDDLSELKKKNINCLISSGAANHLALKDYQLYTDLLKEHAYIAFNLVDDPFHKNRQEILQWMDKQEQFTILDRQKYTHRKLLNGCSVPHEVFLYRVL